MNALPTITSTELARPLASGLGSWIDQGLPIDTDRIDTDPERPTAHKNPLDPHA